MRLPLTLSFLLSAAFCYGQQQSIEQVGAAAQSNLNALAAGLPAVLPGGNAKEIHGSPYADPRWLPAKLMMRSNVPLAPVPLKYDILNRRLLMRLVDRPNDSLQLDDRLVQSFILQEPAIGSLPGRQRLFRRFAEAPNPAHSAQFVEVLHQGKYELVKQYTKTLRKASSGAYNNGDRFDEVEDKNAYFVRRPSGTIVPVKLNLKQLEAAAPDLATALKQAPGAKSANTDAEWSAIFDAIDPKP